MTNPYFPLLIMAAAALVLAFGGLVASAILGPTKKSQTKADNYECGIERARHRRRRDGDRLVAAQPVVRRRRAGP